MEKVFLKISLSKILVAFKLILKTCSRKRDLATGVSQQKFSSFLKILISKNVCERVVLSFV